jgi:hypothetical protein
MPSALLLTLVPTDCSLGLALMELFGSVLEVAPAGAACVLLSVGASLLLLLSLAVVLSLAELSALLLSPSAVELSTEELVGAITAGASVVVGASVVSTAGVGVELAVVVILDFWCDGLAA